MTMPSFTMKELLEAGIHFGHQKNRWNPKMEPYLFGERNGIHIIDLQQSYPLITKALKVLRDVGANGGRVLFVGTKRQAQSIVAETAVNSGQYFMNHRWLGGTLTNWKTISKSIVKLKKYEEILNKEDEVFETLKDLAKNNVDIVTLGQYLQPSKKHLPVKEFINPDQFKKYELFAKDLGFRHVESGPLVRSSYKAKKHIS